MVLLLAALTARADLVETRDGERFEGTITSVTAEAVSIDVQVSETIREERVIPRGDIVRLERQRPDDAAYEEIAALTVPATAQDDEPHRVLLETKVRPFLKNYAYSRHVGKVRAFAKELEAEMQRFSGGEIKVDGVWMTAEQFAEDRPQIEGRLLLAQMRRAAEAGDAAAVLNAFDALGRAAPTSESYPEAVALARQTLDALIPRLTREIGNVEREQARRAEGLAIAREDERLAAERAIAGEKEAMARAIEAARKRGDRWMPPVADVPTLQEQLRQATAEQKRLESLPLAAMEQSVAQARAARQSIVEGDLAAAETQRAEAARLWPQNDALKALAADLEAARKAAEQSSTGSGAAETLSSTEP